MALPLLDESLQRSIDLIRRKVIEMSGLAEQALKAALQALTEDNRTLAYSVVLRDQYIDEAEKELDRLCLEFLVRQQPVAGHLRFAFAVIKINNELERIGDYAESIARQYLSISSLPMPMISYEKFHDIANLAIPMLHDATQAFVDQNAELARVVMEKEKIVDGIRNNIHSELVQLREQGNLPLEALAPLMIVASRFERVADQACNMCEEVLYMCTGEYIKHQGTEVFRVLFVDDGNSTRSQMAEGFGNALGLNKFIFSSAGISPRGLDPRAVRFMQEKGINISRQISKSIDQIPNLEHYQVIIALSKAAQRAFPSMPTKVVSIPWEIPDPAQVRGSAEEVRAAYEHAYQFLDVHVRDLVQAVLGEEELNK